MIRPVCSRCGAELEAFGALVFSAPQRPDGTGPVEKFHLCTTSRGTPGGCWASLLDWIGHWTAHGFVAEGDSWTFDPFPDGPAVVAVKFPNGWTCDVWGDSGDEPIERVEGLTEQEARVWCYERADNLTAGRTP